MSDTFRALNLIPPAVFPKGQPVSASVKIPAGAAEVRWWFVVAPLMAENERFSGNAEIRWRSGSGSFTDENKVGVKVQGYDGAEPGGIVGGLPAELPADFTMFDFDERTSGGGGTSPPGGADYLRVTIVPEQGLNGGGIWCACVAAAFDVDGQQLDFDLTTRGS